MKLPLEKLFGCLWCILELLLAQIQAAVKVNSSFQTGAGSREVLGMVLLGSPTSAGF